MRREPLFVRYANRELNKNDIIDAFISGSEHDKSIKIAQEAKEEVNYDLSVFRRDFINALQDLIDNGINRQLVNYLDSYMKPSLSEIVEGGGSNTTGEKRWAIIKSADAPWIEAVVCYNMTLYIKAYGYKELKRCPVCSKFFTNKGKYAKYCSDRCKGKK